MQDFVWKYVATGVVFWTAAFLVVRKALLPRRSFEFCTRLVSTMHACTAVCLATLSVQEYNWSCPCGSEMVATMWITEISSPFLHLREFLKELGYKDTDLNLAVDILFAVTFTFARMVCGPYLLTVTLLADYPMLIKAMALGLQLVSAFWFYKIARMVRYKLVKRSNTHLKLA